MSIPVLYNILILSILVEIQKLLRWHIQSLGNIKKGVQRQGLHNVGRLQMADEGRGQSHPLSQLLLGQPPELAVLGNF